MNQTNSDRYRSKQPLTIDTDRRSKITSSILDFSERRSYSSDSAFGSPDMCTKTANLDLDETPESERDSSVKSKMNGERCELPPPSPDIAQTDVMTHLSRLREDHERQVILRCPMNGEDTFTSVSSGSDAPQNHLPKSKKHTKYDRGRSVSRRSYSPSSTYHRTHSTDSMTSLINSRQSPHLPAPHLSLKPHSSSKISNGSIESHPALKRNTLHRSCTRTDFTPNADMSNRHLRDFLTPMDFEVPHSQKDSHFFIGREWVFQEMESCLMNCEEDEWKGVIITGATGSGKTAIIEKMVEFSCFDAGNKGQVIALDTTSKPAHPGYYPSPTNTMSSHSSSGSGRYLKQTESSIHLNVTNYSSFKNLSRSIVAHHYCQLDNNVTCLVPDFIHSLAARIASAPQMSAYHDFISSNPDILSILSLSECIRNPDRSFISGILQPLADLYQAGKINPGMYLIVVDALDGSEYCSPDYGHTISSLITKHVAHFPSWLKLILTDRMFSCRSYKSIPFYRIQIDSLETNDFIENDICSYVNYRINFDESVRNNLTVSENLDSNFQLKFVNHVWTLSKGCFLYAKLLMDLIQSGRIRVLSSSFNSLPQNLRAIFLLMLNMKFQSVRSYEKVTPILSVCLASEYPLKKEQIYNVILSGRVTQMLVWDEFTKNFNSLQSLLYMQRDQRYVFFHPAFRDWLIRRDDSDNLKFLCNSTTGHSLLAFYLSRAISTLTSEKVIELVHHILKSLLYRNVVKQFEYVTREMLAYWICLSCRDLNRVLISRRNLFSPNVKVSRLLLLAGADPNVTTDVFSNAPLLCVMSRLGYTDMVRLLLDNGANVQAFGDDHMTPLCHASSAGHSDVVEILIAHNANLAHRDVSGVPPIVHCAANGHLQIMEFLMQLDWLKYTTEDDLWQFMQQALVMAAANNRAKVIDYLLGLPRSDYFGINKLDSVTGETAMTAACLNGRKAIVRLLMAYNANLYVYNAQSLTPLLCAVKIGRWDIVNIFIREKVSLTQVDRNERTALMIAASEGHVIVIEQLVSLGASLEKEDRDGMTALGWGCIKGRFQSVQLLLQRGSNFHHIDGKGRNPLHLATISGDCQTVEYLLELGADCGNMDMNGERPIDRAISKDYLNIITAFINKGVTFHKSTWALATEKSHILLLLLKKLFEDGNSLYKSKRVEEATKRYDFALKKLPHEFTGPDCQYFRDLSINLLVALSRCKCKLGDVSAIDLASKALSRCPESAEAFYVRARALRHNRQLAAAIKDLERAVNLSPTNTDYQRLLQKVRHECNELQRSESVVPRGTGSILDWTPDTRLEVKRCEETIL